MCGLTGFLDLFNSSSQEVLEAMGGELSHRGPDGYGYDFFRENDFQLGLGHRRLSIIDLSEAGRQPMYAADGKYALLFNGEIYNYGEIREGLLQKGYRFRSESDSEVLLYALIDRGLDALHDFIGMFAIVFYDKENKKIYLIRDRAGVKPLYYYYHDGLFLFTSEVRSFLQHPNFNRSLDLQVVAGFMAYGYLKNERSIFQHVRNVPAGSALVFDIGKGKIEIKKYWDIYPFFREKNLDISLGEAALQLEELFVSAFKYRMVSDVPVGVFLSGGIDSSMVAAILQHNCQSPISTFTIGFEDGRFNEADKAKQIAIHLGTRHHELYCTEKELLDIFPRLPDIFDEPFADKSAIPTVLVSEFARKHVKVALSADGGDEVFAGYNKYFEVLGLYDKLRSENTLKRKLQLWAEKGIYGLPDTLLSRHSLLKLKALSGLKAKEHFPDAIKMMIGRSQTFGKKDIHALLPCINWSSELENGIFADRPEELLAQLQAYDYGDYLRNDILVKVDRTTMSTSLEGREPLLDHRIAEFAARLPSEFKWHNGNSKHLLKVIHKKYFPEELTAGPKKGFSIPKKQWLETHLRDYVFNYLDINHIRNIGFFDPGYIEGVLKAYKSGREHNKIWNLLIFSMWHDRWMN